MRVERIIGTAKENTRIEFFLHNLSMPIVGGIIFRDHGKRTEFTELAF